MSGIRPRETKTSEERGRPERHRTGIIPPEKNDELAALEAWMADETVPPGPHGALADLPPLPKQPGMGASEEEVEAYRQAQIRRLEILGLCERKEGGGLKRGIGPPRAGPYEPRRPPLSPEEAKAELKRRGLW
jgi:hypothetical protein